MSKQSNSSQTIEPPLLKCNLNPLAFHISARHYYKCRQDFKCPDKFSAVPYFLLCRSIELSIKARHLKRDGQKKVKEDYWHNLKTAYNALNANEKILTKSEFVVLTTANGIYNDKGFEYFTPNDAMTGYSGYPDLKVLDGIAEKFLKDFKES